MIRLRTGDCLEVFGREPDASFDAQGNVHPTVKRLALVEWLCSLVAAPGDRLGDLTVGSGGTAIAWHRVCARAGLSADFLGTDVCPEAIEIARARLKAWQAADPDARARKQAGAIVLGKPRPRMLGTRPGELRAMAESLGAA